MIILYGINVLLSIMLMGGFSVSHGDMGYIFIDPDKVELPIHYLWPWISINIILSLNEKQRLSYRNNYGLTTRLNFEPMIGLIAAPSMDMSII